MEAARYQSLPTPVRSVEIGFALVTYRQDGDRVSSFDLKEHDVARASESNDELAKEWPVSSLGGFATRKKKSLEELQCFLDRLQRAARGVQILFQQEAVELIEVLPRIRSEPDAIPHCRRGPLPRVAPFRALESRRLSPATTETADVYLPERRAFSPEAIPRFTNSSSSALFRTLSSTAATTKEESVSPSRSRRSASLRSRGSTRSGGRVDVFIHHNVSQVRCNGNRRPRLLLDSLPFTTATRARPQACKGGRHEPAPPRTGAPSLGRRPCWPAGDAERAGGTLARISRRAPRLATRILGRVARRELLRARPRLPPARHRGRRLPRAHPPPARGVGALADLHRRLRAGCGAALPRGRPLPRAPGLWRVAKDDHRHAAGLEPCPTRSDRHLRRVRPPHAPRAGALPAQPRPAASVGSAVAARQDGVERCPAGLTWRTRRKLDSSWITPRVP